MENGEKIVIIGGGLMGSSAAWELAKAGKKVLLIEQQSKEYSFGSSFGLARVSRSLGNEDDIFTWLQQTAISRSQELIDFLNKNEEDEHAMDEIYKTSPVTYIYRDSEQNEIDDLYMDDDFEHAKDPDEARKNFGMKIDANTQVIREFKQHSGTMKPKTLIGKLHRSIQLADGDVSYDSEVCNINRTNSGYEIEVKNKASNQTKTVSAQKVISAAGPYTGELLKNIAPCFRELIDIKRLFLAFFKISENRFYSYDEKLKKRIFDFYPVAEMFHPIYYSMIEEKDSNGIPTIKVGGHYLRSDIVELKDVWKQNLTEEEISWCKKKTLNYFNQIDVPLKDSELENCSEYSCVYSLSRSEIPYVTNLPLENGNPDPNFVVLAAMSGIGAKGSMAYGWMASNLLLDNHPHDKMYQKTLASMGFERLSNDIREYCRE